MTRLNVYMYYIDSQFLDTKVEFLQGWILDKWCQPESKLYHFDNATGQLTIKRGGFYSIDVHVSAIIQPLQYKNFS